MKTTLFILTLVFVALQAAGQKTTDDNKPLFYDNDVMHAYKCTKDYPLISLSTFNGDTLAFLKANFPFGSEHGHFGLTNRTIQALIDIMRKEVQIKTMKLRTNEYGLSCLFLYFETPEQLKQREKKGEKIGRLEIRIPSITLYKRDEILRKYIPVDKWLKWDDKYLEVLGGITYRYALFTFE